MLAHPFRGRKLRGNGRGEGRESMKGKGRRGRIFEAMRGDRKQEK